MIDHHMKCFLTSEIYPFSIIRRLGGRHGHPALDPDAVGVRAAVISVLWSIVTGHTLCVWCTRIVRWAIRGRHQADIYWPTIMACCLFYRTGRIFRPSSLLLHAKGDYFDNGERFIFFCRAALSAMRKYEHGCAHRACPGLARGPGHGVSCVLRRVDPFWAGTRTVMSIHNLAYQGRFHIAFSNNRVAAGCVEHGWRRIL